MNDLRYAPKLVGESTDTKPTVAGGYPTPQEGTTFLEADTGTTYIYVLSSDEWVVLGATE